MISEKLNGIIREYVGISYSTLSKLEKGKNKNVDGLERICLEMDCRIEDTVEILPDQQPVSINDDCPNA